jgi:DNA-binding transcriptional LysR family regulator
MIVTGCSSARGMLVTVPEHPDPALEDELDLRLVRALVRVADTGSFTAAAARLAVSQPALSQQVRRLEAAVGTRLLERSSRGLTLTAAGMEMVSAGRALLAAADQALARVRRVAAGPLEVRVGFVTGVPQLLLNLALAAESEVTRVLLRRLEWTTEAAAVRSGACDLALVQLPVSTEGLVVLPLLVQDRLAVFPAGHPLGERMTLQLADLAGEPIIDAASHRAFWLADPRPDGQAVRTVGPPATTVEEMLASVAAGRGMAITSLGVAEGHPRRDLCFVPIVDLEPVVVAAIWQNDGASPNRGLFVERLQELVGGAVAPAGVRILAEAGPAS